ncbi:MAG: N-acetylmuramoyl-L-alanine amidase [Bacteroidetes bacterium]|jgi:N-acetylmuramoyl-L-alanine amidase|nr:N-acetylmuramoyl-L-alanine amidase [Bacteroidota bacterium]
MTLFNKILSFTTLSLLMCIAATHTKKSTGNVKQKQGVKRVVIDAGHGGVDIGARGSYSNEKTISLQVALKLEQEIKKQMPDVEVYMTRTTDIFDNPKVKANKANAAKGDLFIAIHCNDAGPIRHSEFVGYKTVKYKKGKKWKTRQEKQYRTYTTPNPAKGTETFIWGVGKNEQKAQALRDFDESVNDSTIAEENKKMNDPEQIAMVSLKMSQYAERSRNLAFSVQDEFVKVGRVSREAKQRQVGIWVLQAVAMPAILVELGFISNPEEEEYLNSEKGQNELSECIARAVRAYKANIENKMSSNGGK